MCATDDWVLTAGDLMSRDVEMIHADLPLRDAGEWLAAREIHGAPVVDDEGRCVGVLSVTDVSRWASGRGRPTAQLPRTCAFQMNCREPGGHDVVICRLAEGVCLFQRLRTMADGKFGLACIEPHCVPVDWQIVELEAMPGDRVRDAMTTAVLTVGPAATVSEMAQLMLDRHVNRLVVIDNQDRPVGVVTVNDLIQVVAHPGFIADSAAVMNPIAGAFR